jgi:hypothetical protein
MPLYAILGVMVGFGKVGFLLHGAGNDPAKIRALRFARGALAVDDGFQEKLACGEFDFHADAFGASGDFGGDRFSGDF